MLHLKCSISLNKTQNCIAHKNAIFAAICDDGRLPPERSIPFQKEREHLGSSASWQASRIPEEVTHECNVIRGVSHARQSLVGGNLLVGWERHHLLHLHTSTKQQRLGLLST